jgi:hypothetical protein
MSTSQDQGAAIKGTLFGPVRDDFQALVGRGRLSPEEVETRLEARDVAFLDEKIGVTAWYPIDTYARLLDTLCEVEGGDRADDYLRRRGAAAAHRLIEGGVYSQMHATVDAWGERVGRIMVTLAPLMFNFGRWTCDTSGGGLQVDAEDVAPLPDSTRIVIEGFIEVMATRALHDAVTVRSERPSPGRIHYEGTRG